MMFRRLRALVKELRAESDKNLRKPSDLLCLQERHQDRDEEEGERSQCLPRGENAVDQGPEDPRNSSFYAVQRRAVHRNIAHGR